MSDENKRPMWESNPTQMSGGWRDMFARYKRQGAQSASELMSRIQVEGSRFLNLPNTPETRNRIATHLNQALNEHTHLTSQVAPTFPSPSFDQYGEPPTGRMIDQTMSLNPNLMDEQPTGTSVGSAVITELGQRSFDDLRISIEEILGLVEDPLRFSVLVEQIRIGVLQITIEHLSTFTEDYRKRVRRGVKDIRPIGIEVVVFFMHVNSLRPAVTQSREGEYITGKAILTPPGCLILTMCCTLEVVQKKIEKFIDQYGKSPTEIRMSPKLWKYLRSHTGAENIWNFGLSFKMELFGIPVVLGEGYALTYPPRPKGTRALWF